MKRNRSSIELKVRKAYSNFNKALFGSEKNKHILPALRLRYPDLKFAYMIEWIPEQGEDIYYILVNSTKIAIVEVDRLNNSIDTLIIEIPLDDFLQRDIYDVQRFRIRAALELAGGIN